MLREAKPLGLQDYLARLAEMRKCNPALRYGTYQQVTISSNQFVFLRQWQGQSVLGALNSAQEAVRIAGAGAADRGNPPFGLASAGGWRGGYWREICPRDWPK